MRGRMRKKMTSEREGRETSFQITTSQNVNTYDYVAI
jgi:hypothetical protein